MATGATDVNADEAVAGLYLGPDDLSARFCRQDVLSRAEAGQLLRRVRRLGFVVCWVLCWCWWLCCAGDVRGVGKRGRVEVNVGLLVVVVAVLVVVVNMCGVLLACSLYTSLLVLGLFHSVKSDVQEEG